MAVSLDDARDWLRIDGTDNDAVIQALLSTAPAYIEAATGLPEKVQTSRFGYSELCNTCTRYLLTLWYYGESADTERIQTIVDSLLKSIASLRGDWTTESFRY